MWVDLQIDLPGEVSTHFFPDGNKRDFRKVVARLNGEAGDPIPSEFFNYANGGTVHGMAPVRFASYRNGVRIYGVGVRGADLVEQYGARVRRLLSDDRGVPLTARISSGQNAISIAERRVTYRLPAVVIEPRKGRWWDLVSKKITRSASDGDLPEVREATLAAIRTGISRQVQDLHSTEIAVLGQDVDLEDITWDILGIEGLTQVTIRHPLVIAKHVKVRGILKLDGIWHVGRLCSYGFGQVLPNSTREAPDVSK